MNESLMLEKAFYLGIMKAAEDHGLSLEDAVKCAQGAYTSRAQSQKKDVARGKTMPRFGEGGQGFKPTTPVQGAPGTSITSNPQYAEGSTIQGGPGRAGYRMPPVSLAPGRAPQMGSGRPTTVMPAQQVEGRPGAANFGSLLSAMRKATGTAAPAAPLATRR